MTYDHVVGWVIDPDEPSTHNVQPRMCSEYVAALEELVRSGIADSSDLERVQKAHGISRDGLRSGVAVDIASAPDGSFVRYAQNLGTGSISLFDGSSAGSHQLGEAYIRDTIANIEEWRAEIMAQILATGRARLSGVPAPGYEITVDWDRSGDLVEDLEHARDWMSDYSAEQNREQIAAFMRENGFAVWARPAEGLVLGEDGFYRRAESALNSEIAQKYPGFPIFNTNVFTEQPGSVPQLGVIIFNYNEGDYQAYVIGTGSDRGVPICPDHDIRLGPDWHCDLCKKRHEKA